MNDNFDYKADLRKRLPELKNIEGFPIGDDEDILALSNPPFYTACPNPYINDFIEKYGTPYNEETDDYHREPFVADVSEGKNNPVYNAHTYHTKVPHTAIEKYINHYTNKGDIVLDGFCGTGMTGVAAKDLNRYCIQSDLSPIASFISSCIVTNADVNDFKNEANRIISKFEENVRWLYTTTHNHVDTQKSIKSKDDFGIINFILYSDILKCPYCSFEFAFYNVAYDEKNKVIRDNFNCPNCNANISKIECEQVFSEKYDSILNKVIFEVKQLPVLINYSKGKKRFEKEPDVIDFELEAKIDKFQISNWIPIVEIPDGDKTKEPKKLGYNYFHQIFTKRNLIAISIFVDIIKGNKFRNELLFGCTAVLPTLSKLRRFRPDKKGGGPLNGTYYMASLITPPNVILSIKRNLTSMISALNSIKDSSSLILTSVSSATELLIKDNSIDYIFTDPPFGSNLMYSELNLIWESWLKVKTNNEKEAIVNKTQHKSNIEYEILMKDTFNEYYRVLKPKRWITVEFHNSKSNVWNLIQDGYY